MLNSLIEVAQAIQSGKIGVIDAVKIGDVVVSALTGVRGGDSVTITERDVQAGFLVTEGVVKDPTERTLDIVLADPEISLESGLSAALTGEWAGFTETWRDKKATLKAHFDNHDIITVVTHDEVLPRMLIKSITPIYDAEENWDCFIAQVEVRKWNERSTTAAADVEHAITAAEVNVGAL